MPNFTKNAIKTSFLKLLNERPLGKISVRDIVEDCGINRNSFYYHYQDIPALIEEIVREHFDVLIREYPNVTSLRAGVNAAIRSALERKRAVLHIYNSVNRDIFERYLMAFCEEFIRAYFQTAFADAEISEKDREIMIRLLKCEVFGACIDWVSSGMPETVEEDTDRLFTVCEGLSEDIIQRCKSAK